MNKYKTTNGLENRIIGIWYGINNYWSNMSKLQEYNMFKDATEIVDEDSIWFKIF